ncbi:MAG: hypothetical protein ACRDHD_13100, partial [Candidatus Limnocylindria bacterium]
HDPLTGAYDWAGTALLVATGIAAALVVAVMAAHVRRAVGDGGSSPLRRLGGWLGLGDPTGAGGEQPLAAGLDRLPTSSIWPLLAGVSATMLGLGLIYGPWLWLPGGVLLAATVWGWITQLEA